jgi:hypothetical protein
MEAGLAIALLAVAIALPVYGQAASGTASGYQLPPLTAEAFQIEVVREIDDPETGTRWLLVRDKSHPGGPGRMAPAAELENAQFANAEIKNTQIANAGFANKDGLHIAGVRSRAATVEPLLAAHRPVVRAGDRLIVEEHTSAVDAHLEAVALGPAMVGATLNARLKIGGKVVRVTAVEAGRATLAPEQEARP